MLGLVFAIAYMIYLYYISSIFILLFYIVYVVSLVGFVLLLTFVIFPIKDFHLHHWFITLILVTLSAHPNWFVTALNGVVSGIFVEGCARWGLDPVWKKVDLAGRV